MFEIENPVTATGAESDSTHAKNDSERKPEETADKASETTQRTGIANASRAFDTIRHPFAVRRIGETMSRALALGMFITILGGEAISPALGSKRQR